DPRACSLAGRPPEIYLSTGMRRVLSDDECAAIIAHEKSHVLRRHNLVLRVAAVNSASLPRRLPASQRFRATVLTLVEMIADDDAVQATSAATVRDAKTADGLEGISDIGGHGQRCPRDHQRFQRRCLAAPAVAAAAAHAPGNRLNRARATST